ncbi:uncharacterized protein LOC126909192, partial [Daktulosphaira vitifoliae]|uniref:uncharacterized protein LOC126909192 n=1 Tax=Daktulosphaira vitifoliae TaxID=58002 RepID=UPI0021AA84A3
MARKINLKKLATVLIKYKCDPCFWKNIKIGDEVIYAAAKACLKNTSSISRKRIALILVEGRCNILNVYNGIQEQKTNFMDQVRCILLNQIVNVTDVNSDIILKVCKKLGFNFNKKSKIQKTLIIEK